MVRQAMARAGFGAALVVGVLIVLAAPGFAHSGGTDKYGCHAGTQPYHCHGGGSGGSSGGSGGGSAPPVNTGPSAAEQAEIASTKSELSQARFSFAQSQPRADQLEKRLEKVEEKLDDQRSGVQDLQDEVDRGREEADSLRAAHIEELNDAAERVELVNTSNHEAREEFTSTRLATVYLAAFFGGFLLFSIVKLMAASIVGIGWRIAAATAGLFGSFALLGLALSIGSFGIGIVPATIGGLLLSFVFTLARAWWTAATLPVFLTVTFVGLAVAAAAVAIATTATIPPPAAEQPAQEDQALVEEAQVDPTAEGLEEAQAVDADAEELEVEVDDLTTALEKVESKVEDLADRTEAAKTKAEKDAKAIESAEEELSSLQ